MSFNPSKDIPDLSGKVIIVTGGTQGLGRETAKELAQHNPAKLYLAARNKSKYDETLGELKGKGIATDNIRFLSLNLASLQSVSTAAKQILSAEKRLDLVFNNAGAIRTEPALSEDGYEIHFATNHLGHVYLVRLLMPLLLKTASLPKADVRVIVVTSEAEGMAGNFKPPYMDAIKTTMAEKHPYVLYGQSKVANIFFTTSMSTHYPSIKTIAVHPGRVRTHALDEIYARKHSFTALLQRCYDLYAMTELEEGVKNQLWAAVASDAESGVYYSPVGKVSKASKPSKSKELAENLWEWQEAEFDAFEAQKAH